MPRGADHYSYDNRWTGKETDITFVSAYSPTNGNADSDWTVSISAPNQSFIGEGADYLGTTLLSALSSIIMICLI